jgi:8-oxo-dGTP pyrophosphatase MutT (NUDIX family)
VDFIQSLFKELEDLPGISAHKKFYPLRFTQTEKPINPKLSAVAIHLFNKNKEWYFIVIERSEYDGHHSKQIAFPGGKMDPSDSTLEETARRESIEEINIKMDHAKIVGKITPVYIPISNFEVHPYIFAHSDEPILKASIDEVNEIVFIKCSDLLDDKNLKYTDIEITKGSTMKKVPCFTLENKIIWGATALILSEIKELLKRL